MPTIVCPECGHQMIYAECYWYDCPNCGFATTKYPKEFIRKNLIDRTKLF